MYRNIRANKKNFLKAIWKKIYDLRNTEYVFILCRILWMLNETISNIKATHFYSYLQISQKIDRLKVSLIRQGLNQMILFNVNLM